MPNKYSQNVCMYMCACQCLYRSTYIHTHTYITCPHWTHIHRHTPDHKMAVFTCFALIHTHTHTHRQNIASFSNITIIKLYYMYFVNMFQFNNVFSLNMSRQISIMYLYIERERERERNCPVNKMCILPLCSEFCV